MDDPSRYHEIFEIPNNASVEIIEDAYQVLINKLGGTNSRRRLEQLTKIRDYLVTKKKEETLQNGKHISNPTGNNFLLTDEDDFSFYDPSKCFQQLKIPEESSIEMLEELRERLISNSNKWREEKMDYAVKHFEKEAKLCTFLIRYKTKQMQSQNQESFEELMSEDEDPLPNDLSNDFKILNISENSSMEIIEAAYQRLIKEINFPCGKNAVAIAKSKLLTEAYENLKKYNSDNVNDRPMDACERLYPDLSNDLNSETPMDWNSSDQDLLISYPKTENEDDLIKTHENVYSTVQNNDTNVKDPIIEISSNKDPILQNPIAEDSNSKNNEIVVKESINATNYPDEKASNEETPVKRDFFLSFEEIFRGEIKRLKLRVMDGDTKVKDEFIKVRIKPGTIPETEIPFPQQANTGSITSTPELILVVRDKPNQKFKRLSNVDIEYTARITTKESKEGFELSVPTLENDPITMTFEDEITLDTIEEFTDRGLPFEGNKGKRGKLVVRFEINDDSNVKKITNETFKDDNIIIVERKSKPHNSENNFEISTNSRINITSASNQNLINQNQNFKAPLSQNVNSPVENRKEHVRKENNKSDLNKHGSSDDFEFIDKKELDKNKSKFESQNAKNNGEQEKPSNFPKPQKELPPSRHELKLTLEEIFRGCVKKQKIKIDNKINGNFEKILNVRVKPGTLNDENIVVPFECDNGYGIISAVAVFVVCVEPHSIFKRYGNDIEYTAKITPKEAILGGKLTVPTLENEPCELVFKGGITPNSNQQRILRKGLPIPGFEDQRGELLVKFEIMMEQDMEQDPPVEYELQATLEQILNGFSKKVKIVRMKFDANGNREEEKRILKVDIKPGSPAGTKISFPREGDQNPGRIPADIVFKVCDKAHEKFTRKGADIEYFVKLHQSELSNGGKLEIPTLDDGVKYISYDGILNKSGTKRITKCGLPHFEDQNKRGDLIVRYEVVEDPQEEAIENFINFTLDQIMNGCSKRLKIKRKTFDSHDNEISSKDEIITLDLKPGTETGYCLTFPKMGDKYQGKTPADLVFIVCDKEHPFFERSGMDIYYTAKITENESKNGFKLEIPTMQGEILEFTKKGTTDFNDVKRYPGRGLPYPDNTGKRGDLIVKFSIVKNNFKDASTKYNLPLSLFDILDGCTKNMKITRKIIDNNGKETETEKTLSFDVLPGTRVNDKFTFARQGHQYFDRIPGDIIFVASEIEHDLFKRNGDDIVYTVTMNESEANLGCTLDIPTLENDSKQITLKKVPKNYLKPFKKLGLPNKETKVRGNLIVKIDVIKDDKDPSSNKTNEQMELQTLKPPKEKVSTQKYELLLTLHDILHGYKKKRTHFYKVIDKAGNPHTEERILHFDVQPGVADGTEILFEKMGDHKTDMIPADVVYEVKVEPNAIFVRDGNDLLYTAKITQEQASGNSQTIIPTLDGDSMLFPIEEPIVSFCTRKVEGLGLPKLNQPKIFGDLFIRFEIEKELQTDSAKIHVKQNESIPQNAPNIYRLPVSLANFFQGFTFSSTVKRKILDIEEENRYFVQVYPKVSEGINFIFHGYGDKVYWKSPSDVVFITVYEDFIINGIDIELTISIEPKLAKEKFKVWIPTHEGGEWLFSDPIYEWNYIRTLRGRGFLDPNNPNIRGNIMVRFEISKNGKNDKKEQKLTFVGTIKKEIANFLADIIPI